MKPATAFVATILLAGLLAAPAARSADLARGGELYQRHCAQCHGSDGVSTWPGAPNIARREGMMQTDMTLLQKLRAGRGAKPAFQGMVSDPDLMSVIAYSRTLMR